MPHKSRIFGVVGLGNFGSTVATELMRFGNSVIAVDVNERAVGLHADKVTEALIVDARDEEALREAGFGECYGAVIAIANDIESSILAAMNLKLIGVKTIWAKAVSKTHHRILSRIGVDRVIHPQVHIGQYVAQVLNNPLIRDYVSLGNGYHVVNFRVPDSLEGHSLSEIKSISQHDLRCIGVMRGTEFVGSGADGCVLQSDDLLLLLGERKKLSDFAASL